MITAWHCPQCSQTVPLDHFQRTACGQLIHPDFAAAVLADVNGNEDRRGRIGVSDATGCPRRRGILESEGVAVDPMAYNSVLTGTAWHRLLEATAVEPKATEVEVAGMLDGIPLTGHIDRVRGLHDGTSVIEDHKHSNDFARRDFIKPDATPKAEHVVTTSIYAHLYEQQCDAVIAGVILWYHFTVGGMVPLAAEVLSVAACLAHHPYDCDFTVREIYKQVWDYLGGVPWHSLPLTGRTMKFGAKTACSYCSVYDVCNIAAFGAPF